MYFSTVKANISQHSPRPKAPVVWLAFLQALHGSPVC